MGALIVLMIGVALVLGGCRATDPEYVSLKDTEPKRAISRHIKPVKLAAPTRVQIAPVVVVANSAPLALDLQIEMMIKLAAQGHVITDKGQYYVTGVITETPAAVTWTIIGPDGKEVGTIVQSNPSGSVAGSTEIIASAAAVGITRLINQSRP